MIKIIDNFLTKSYHEDILKHLTSSNFEWSMYNPNYIFFGPSSPTDFDYRDDIQTKHKYYGFAHQFWSKEVGPASRLFSFINPLLLHIQDVANCDMNIRARADMLTWVGKEKFAVQETHIDFPYPNTASVFYVNESDGDTIFYNAKPADLPEGKTHKDLKIYDRVSPKANRLVLFDGDLLHTGCSPTKHKNRILINSNYIKKEYKEENIRLIEESMNDYISE